MKKSLSLKNRYLNKAVSKIVRSSQWGGDVHPPGTASSLLPRKDKKNCPALTKSSKEAALPCPQEKQRGSCTALTEKQRVAALRPENSNGDTSLRFIESYDPKRLHGCGFILLLLVFFFLSFICSAGTPPGLLPTSGGGSRSSCPACTRLPVEDDACGH